MWQRSHYRKRHIQSSIALAAEYRDFHQSHPGFFEIGINTGEAQFTLLTRHEWIRLIEWHCITGSTRNPIFARQTTSTLPITSWRSSSTPTWGCPTHRPSSASLRPTTRYSAVRQQRACHRWPRRRRRRRQWLAARSPLARNLAQESEAGSWPGRGHSPAAVLWGQLLLTLHSR